MATLNELEERVRSLEGKVEEISRQRPPRRTFAGIELTDNDELVRLFNELFHKLGYDISGPVLPAEEVQQRMLAHGVRPEDRLISSGIRELRGESDEP
jgi:hypothetical protein